MTAAKYRTFDVVELLRTEDDRAAYLRAWEAEAKAAGLPDDSIEIALADIERSRLKWSAK